MKIGAVYDPSDITLSRKLRMISWPLVLLLCVLSAVGFGMLYSAANASWTPWALRQFVRFGIGLTLLLTISLTDIRMWMRYAYFLYFLALALLIAVELMGVIGMGAQRWIDLKIIRIQPSEIMKITLVLALARYFHGISAEETGRIIWLLFPVMLVMAPLALVLRQPDLGTAVMMGMSALAVFFVAGVRLWKFAVAGGLTLAALPVAWSFLHEYQKRRVLTFLDPESDPLGSGYHIIQSKIALGSGGIFGKGFLEGTQSHLNFLPEKQTDFIFTMLAEEFGMVGGLALLALYILIIAYGFVISLRLRNQFSRLASMGIVSVFFFYMFINIAMVMGLVPIVGVPLPMVSYGGTSMLSLMIGFGIIISSNVHRDLQMDRRGENII
ncbi:MAG: rod shape-determining protein RodA [Rhodospirillaceae bacterium]|nr:rod shape-determining protein RodA [Rhodospirillaceae bacterium]